MLLKAASYLKNENVWERLPSQHGRKHLICW